MKKPGLNNVKKQSKIGTKIQYKIQRAPALWQGVLCPELLLDSNLAQSQTDDWLV